MTGQCGRQVNTMQQRMQAAVHIRRVASGELLFSSTSLCRDLSCLTRQGAPPALHSLCQAKGGGRYG